MKLGDAKFGFGLTYQVLRMEKWVNAFVQVRMSWDLSWLSVLINLIIFITAIVLDFPAEIAKGIWKSAKNGN